MRYKETMVRIFLALTCVLWIFSCTNQADYWNKKFSPDQLKEDLKFTYDVLKQNHPRLYEFTAKKEMDVLFDSLYSSITSDMNENEFSYFVSPLVTRVHCGHTWLDTSPTWKKNSSKNCICPPFKLFYEDGKAYILLNFSENKELPPGTELISVNEVPVSQIINNYLLRTTSEGVHKSAQYWLMNHWNTSLFKGYRDYYKTENYKLKIRTKEKAEKTIVVHAIKHDDYQKLIRQSVVARKHQTIFLKEGSLAYMDFPSFVFPKNLNSESFFSSTFKSLKDKNTKNLIIDMRGNAGGPGEVSGSFLQYLMRDTFTYYNPNSTGKGYAEFKKPIEVFNDRYHGNIYFLIDGGCYSSCGHFLSMVKYYKLGKLIGETSSSGFSCNSNGVPFQLPNTQMDLYCSLAIFETNVDDVKRADGIPPDYEVKTTLQDIIKKKDPVRDYALKLIVAQNK